MRFPKLDRMHPTTMAMTCHRTEDDSRTITPWKMSKFMKTKAVVVVVPVVKTKTTMAMPYPAVSLPCWTVVVLAVRRHYHPTDRGRFQPSWWHLRRLFPMPRHRRNDPNNPPCPSQALPIPITHLHRMTRTTTKNKAVANTCLGKHPHHPPTP